MDSHRKLTDLLVDKNRFRDVLEFTNGPMTTECIKNTVNPYLVEIRNKIQNPNLKQFSLQKSLLLSSSHWKFIRSLNTITLSQRSRFTRMTNSQDTSPRAFSIKQAPSASETASGKTNK